MTIEVALLISVMSVSFGIYQGVSNLKRNKTVDDRKEASEMTTVIVKLEGIGKDTSEIKNDIRSVKEKVEHHGELIIRIDESLKSAWRAINRLQEKEGESHHVD